MGEEENRRSVQRYFEAVSAKDFDAMSDLRHNEFIQEWPQMKERTRGKQNARLINENHPGLPRPWIKRIMGGGDYWVAETTLTYSDGSVWDAVNIFEFKDGKIARQTDYFGQPIQAPAWRAQWVERMG
jgi:ketosteroid isomerase-like protein